MEAPRNEAIVLEIGSGSNPWPRSDVLVDRYYVDGDGQRGGGEIYRDRRPLIIASGEALPFVDKAFDFVYCYHVIEHAEDISSFLNEMSRVAKGGYLESPNPALECVLDQPQHNWYIAISQNKLLISAKSPDSLPLPFSRFYFHMMSDHFIIRNYFDIFTVRLEWKDSIKYVICSDPAAVFVDPISEEQVVKRIKDQRNSVLLRSLGDAIKEGFRDKIQGWLHTSSMGRVIRQMRHRIQLGRRMNSSKARLSMTELETLLCCPKCKGELDKSTATYQCKRCDIKYPINQGVPVFL